MSTTIRISQSSLKILRQMAAEAGEPMQALLDKAIEAYQRQCLLRETNEAYAALRADAKAWQEEMAERNDWEAAIADDLPEDEAER